MFGWGRKAREIEELEILVSVRGMETEALRKKCTRLEGSLRTIADMETPSANATVKRMAKVAREAL